MRIRKNTMGRACGYVSAREMIIRDIFWPNIRRLWWRKRPPVRENRTSFPASRPVCPDGRGRRAGGFRFR